MTNQEILTKVKNYFETAITHPTTTDRLKNAKKDYEFHQGDQWSSAEKVTLRERGQPEVVENEIQPRVNRIVGQYKQIKTRIKFRGRNMDFDEATAQTLSDLTLYVQQSTGYEYEEGEMFIDGQISGFGCIECYVEFDDMYQPSIRIRHEDSLNVFPDPYSIRYDWGDANFVCRAKWIPMDDAKALYPDKVVELNGFVSYGQAETQGIDTMRKLDYVDEKFKRVRLVEVWYKEKEKRVIAIIPGNMQEGISSDVQDATKFSETKLKKLEKQGAKIVDKLEEKIKMAVYCGSILLESKDSPYNHKKFPLIPYYVFRKKNGEPYSIVRALISPQEEINKRRSKALHLLNTNQAIMEEGSVIDEDELRREIAKPDGIIKVRKYDRFQLVKNVELAQSQMGLLAESKESVKRISGIQDTPADTGQLRSGAALQRKQAMTDVILTPIFENLRRTRMLIGKQIYELIKQYFTEEKMYYVLDDINKARQVELTDDILKKIKEAEYDIIVEEAPDTTTIQDEQFGMLSQLIQGFQLPPNLSMAILPVMIKLSQLRDKDSILQQFSQLSQPSPIQPKMSLQLTWDNLMPQEKAAFAQSMGMQELAQFEAQGGVEAAFLIKEKAGITKAEIKAQTELQNSAEDPMAKVLDLKVKGAEAQMKLQQSDALHRQKMKQSDEQHRLSMVQKAMEADRKREEDGDRDTDST